MSQTYPNRYLIIINDGDYRFDVRSGPSGRIIQIQPKGWHDARLMAQQYGFQQAAGVDVCALGRQVKYVIGMNSA